MTVTKGWNTVIFNILAVAFGALEAFDWTDVLTPEYQGYFIAAIGAINIFLRARTNTPIGRKE